jgi:dCTP deaminase
MNNGGILTGPAIRDAQYSGTIEIDPWNVSQLNPASYDLTLGDTVKVYQFGVNRLQNTKSHPIGFITDEIRQAIVKNGGDELVPDCNWAMSVRRVEPTYEFKIDPNVGWVLKPGIGYLMHTAERVWSDRYVPVIDGKSSIGRLFIAVHITAGYGDTGFNGQYTLEVTAVHPVIVYPGMRFCQMRFHTAVGEVLDYANCDSHYTGANAMGAVASQAYKQFLHKE